MTTEGSNISTAGLRNASARKRPPATSFSTLTSRNRKPLGSFSKRALATCLLASVSARAETASEPLDSPGGDAPPKNALLLNPVGPLLGVLVAQLSDAADSVYSFNLRYHRELHPNLALTVVPVFTTANLLTISFRSAGVKLGARLSSSAPGLDGWYLTPMLLGGGLWASQGDHRLTSAISIGVGIEGGYCWNWDGFLLELGAGAQTSGYLAHRAFDDSPIPEGGLRPLINLSLGHDF